jgi:two-component system OmpR family sensor kinase
LSIRLRLTLLYCLILALTLVAFDFALYFEVSNDTMDLVDDTLRTEEMRIIGSTWFKLKQIDYSTKQLAAAEIFVQTMDLDGNILDRTDNLGDYAVPITPATLEKVSNGQIQIETVSVVDNGRLRVYSKRVKDFYGSMGIIQVGRSLTDYDQTLDTLRRLLMVGSFLGVIVAFGAGWFLAGITLQPIARIASTAQKIGRDRDFNRRVDNSGPNDELGRLAITINDMLGKLQEAYQHVDHTLQAQRRFVADASHELRTPLTTLRGNLELLRRDPPISKADHRAAVSDMVEETERLIRLSNDLLMLARTDAGYRLQSFPVPLSPLIDEVCRQVQSLNPQRLPTCEPIEDISVMGNRDALKQILLILLDNALKYSQGAIRISVTRQGQQVAISVTDSGPGIDPQHLEHIFDRFYRGDDARSGGGVGLGLAIARALAEAQNGQLRVDSQVGQGSSFSVVLLQG